MKQTLHDPLEKALIQIEFDAFMKNQTWSLVSIPLLRKIVGDIWINKVKHCTH